MEVTAHPAGDDALSDRINETTKRLTAEFGGKFSPQAIEDAAQQSLRAFEHASVLDFVPLFVERETRARLKERIVQAS